MRFNLILGSAIVAAAISAVWLREYVAWLVPLGGAAGAGILVVFLLIYKWSRW